MAEDIGDRSEQPTGRRLTEARGRGQVARSTDLSAAITLSAVVVLALFLAPTLLVGLSNLLRHALSADVLGSGFDRGPLVPQVTVAFGEAGRLVAPIMLALAVIALAGGVYQVGWHPSVEPIKPKLNKLNFFANAKNLANKKALVKGGLDLLKFSIIATVVFIIIKGDYDQMLALANLDLVTALFFSTEMLRELAIWILAVLITLAVIDFRYQQWQHKEDLKMTKQEVKDEHRSSEGDPEVKSRRLRVARQIALQRLGADVPKADVIVTNPTHFAVALKYDAASGMRAPKVIAKGADYLALKMRYIAAAHGVPIVERPPLARALYSQIPVGKEIFPEHYEAVAEVLAYVYRLAETNPAPRPAQPAAAAF